MPRSGEDWNGPQAGCSLHATKLAHAPCLSDPPFWKEITRGMKRPCCCKGAGHLCPLASTRNPPKTPKQGAWTPAQPCQPQKDPDGCNVQCQQGSWVGKAPEAFALPEQGGYSYFVKASLGLHDLPPTLKIALGMSLPPRHLLAALSVPPGQCACQWRERPCCTFFQEAETLLCQAGDGESMGCLFLRCFWLLAPCQRETHMAGLKPRAG